MRWLVFFLFVLNGLIFVWFSFQEERQAQIAEQETREAFDFSSVKKITLLSELPEPDLDARDARQHLGNDNGVQSSQIIEEAIADTCVLIGPFLEVISAKQAKSRLEESGLPSKTVMVLKELPAINWVYIAPLADRKTALALLRDLQSKNIDSFLIADGEFENGISLGFFSSLDSALAVLAERKKQGYPVSLVEKKRDQKTYWLAFDQEISPRINESQLDKLEEGSFAVKKQDKSCSEVALLQIIE
jgi:hypothetical protein